MPPITDPRDALFDVTEVKKDLGKRTGKSAAAVLVFSVIKLVIALFTTAILARLIPPSQHGLLALAMPVVLIASGLSEFGLAQAITQMEHVTHRLVSTLFWVNVSLGLALCLFIMALSTKAAEFYNQPGVTMIFIVLAPYVFFSVLNTQYMAMLRRQLRIKTIETCVLSATIISALVAIILAWFGYGVTALIAQLLVQQGLTFVFLVFVTKWYPSPPWDADLVAASGALKFGGFLAAERMLNDVGRTFQIALIGKYFGEVSAGIYYRTETFALMPQRRVVSPLSAAFIPSLSRLQDDMAGFQAMFLRQISRGNLILVPIGAVLCTCPDIIVRVLLGPEWEAAIQVLPWLGLLTLTALTTNVFAWSMVASGKARELLYYRLISFVIIVISVLIGLSLGFIQLVAAYAIAVSLLNLLLLSIFVVKFTKVSRKTVLACLAENFALVIMFVATGFGSRILIDSSMLVETLVTGTAITMVLLLYIMSRQALRRDLLKVIRR
ncbi:MAG: hypothetical protein COA47_18025 [Robiginitomaculum sp.]|nr:MAG: hypothetical protein COA47_18025 [Robiginitomaculum sp.]